MNAIQPCSNTSAELPYKALKLLRQIQRYKHGTVLSVFVTTLLVGCSSGSSTNTPEQTDTTDPVVATLDTANLKSTAANAFGTSVDTAVITVSSLSTLMKIPCAQNFVLRVLYLILKFRRVSNYCQT